MNRLARLAALLMLIILGVDAFNVVAQESITTNASRRAKLIKLYLPPAPDQAPVPEPEPDPPTDPDPALDLEDTPDLGPRGLAQNNAYKGPYVPAQSRMPTFTYLGGFQLDDKRYGVSSIASTKGGFSVVGGRVWIVGNRTEGRNVGAFEVPALAMDPENAKAQNVVPFFKVGEVDGQHLTDVFYDEYSGWLILSNTVFYDATKSNKCFIITVRADGSDQQPCYDVRNRQFAAGSIVKTPPGLVERLGGRLCMHGEHWINIISRYSNGPSLHCYDPQLPDPDQRVSVVEHMYYPHTQTVGQHGSSSLEWVEAEQKWQVKQRTSNPIFNRLARYEGCFFWEPTDSYICVGIIGGQKYGDWYGPRKNQPRTHVQKGTHTGHPDELPTGRLPNGEPEKPGTLNHLRDMSNYYWITPISAILSADKPWGPEPVEWGYLNPLLGERPGRILGAYFDTDFSRLYLLTGKGVIRVYDVSG
ncbi:MAG: hypothetical protein AAFY29_09125 [Pseudomonadota bacterium]